eukprot:2136331-Amphidinium_carterae.1
MVATPTRSVYSSLERSHQCLKLCSQSTTTPSATASVSVMDDVKCPIGQQLVLKMSSKQKD